MVHVVFSEADKDALAKSVDPESQEDLLVFEDHYSFGPIDDIYSEEEISGRKQWWQQIIEGSEFEGRSGPYSSNDQQVLDGLIQRLSAGEDVWIWAAQNAHDVSAYYWLIAQLKAFQGQVYILYLNNLPFINEKGQLFYPDYLSQIPAREFAKARKLARPVTLSEFEIDPDECKRLAEEKKSIRILEGGKKLVQFDVDHFDKDLLQLISSDWIKASRLVQQFLSRKKQTAHESFLHWRIREMISQGQLDSQGQTRSLKDLEIKKPVGS